MQKLFMNAPIQNGDFSFDSSPHKLVGIRLAEALNSLDQNPAAPHLWNTVRLAGDIEYAEYQADGGELERAAFECQKIANRYDNAQSLRRPDGKTPTITDADPEVEKLAHTLIENGLASGKLAVVRDSVHICSGCGHHAGLAAACGACSSTDIKWGQASKLMAIRDDASPLILPADTYASIKTKYIADTANHVPNPLSVSATRQHGISLEPFGLHGQVLDPRAGLHVTALAAAERLGAKTAIMLTTGSVAIKFLAYGQHFRSSENTDLRYGLYGRVPYKELVTDPPVRDSADLERIFQQWFLPLQSLVSREPITTDQARALRKFFGKLSLAPSSEAAAAAVKAQIDAESLRWITDKALLSGVKPGS